MQIFNSLLAETVDQVVKNQERIGDLPEWIIHLILGLLGGIAVVVVFVFLGQKKIAQNQVNLAKMMQELYDKE